MTSPSALPFEIDHVAIAVPSLDAALTFWRDQLGAEVLEFEDVPTQRVRVAFIATGASKTELLEPTSPDSPIAKFLAQGRQGLHHVAYRVPDLDSALARLRDQGARLIHDAPVPGSRGTRVAFIHPAAAGGVLIELVERPETPPANDTETQAQTETETESLSETQAEQEGPR